jgi:2-polyprenyl-3-methyl-5-hydroxy-6-metoxy-1,4-benzoquinol methylase
MAEYVLDHHLEGERSRLALMSRLLDPMHRRHIESLAVGPGARALEVGCGNGSISAWLAERVGPRGQAVALDLDLSLVDVRAPRLELRQGDIVAGPVDPGGFDLVTARAVLHHVTDVDAATRNLAASLAPGGSVSVAEPPEVRAFWSGWLAWSREEGIDYHLGRTLAPRLAAVGLEQVAGTAETAVYNGGSAVGGLLDADGHRATRPAPGLGEARRPAHRPLPRPLRRSGLVDADHRLHRCPRPRSRRLSGVRAGDVQGDDRS